MPINDETAAEIKRQLGDWTPSDGSSPAEVREPPQAESGWNFGESVQNASGDLAARFKQGIRGGDAFIKAGILTASGMGTLLPEKGKAGEITRSIMSPPFESQKKEIEERASHPKSVVGKVFGGGAEGVGAMVTMPMGGGIARNIIAGIGMGEGADLGRSVLGPLFSYFGGESGRKTGEAVGSVLGGGIGSQANITRMKAMGEVASQGYGAVKSAYSAMKSARAKVAADDSLSLWSTFADEFGSLRANTRGVVQNFVNRNLAAAINKDIRASKMAEDFVKDAAITGIDTKPWGLGERTLVPTLTETIAGAHPGSYAEATEISGRAKAMQTSIGNAFNKLVTTLKIPATTVGINAAAKVFQGITQAKVDALARETGQIKEQFKRLDPTQEFQVGEHARTVRDRLRDEAYARGSAQYAYAEQIWDAPIASGNIRQEGKKILQDFYSQVDPKEVPPVVRDMLGATKAEKGATSGLILPEEIAAERAAKESAEEAAGKPLTLKEANDLYKAFGQAAANAQAAEHFTAATRAKSLQKQLVESINDSKASPEAKKAWQSAVDNWRTDYAERFQEGLGKAMGKERGGAYEGRESLKSEKIMDEALSGETSMQEFDRLYGQDPSAKGLLSVSLQDKFRKEVFDRPYSDRTFESTLNEFKRKYAPGLQRMPEIAEKIDRESANMILRQNEKSMELQRYKDIMGADVSKEIGPLQAKQMFQSALSDPLKMKQLIAADKGSAKNLVKEVFNQGNPFKNGEYDPDAILTMVQAGKREAGSPSSMELLFTEAFGAKEGQRHLATLEAIANFTKRQLTTDPRFLSAANPLSTQPVKEATGSTAASWINNFRAAATGQIRPGYAAMVGLSRFANAKAQNAIERAKRVALYDPDTADAILELASKDSSQSLSMTTAKKLWGDIRLDDGTKLLDKLIDRGYVKAYISRGLIYGAEHEATESENPNERSAARRLREESNAINQ